jgi:uncharacterized membrane protein YqiK
MKEPATISALRRLMEMAELIRSIQGALGTEETGDGLIDVARRAHRSEQAYARLVQSADEAEITQHRAEDAAEILRTLAQAYEDERRTALAGVLLRAATALDEWRT